MTTREPETETGHRSWREALLAGTGKPDHGWGVPPQAILAIEAELRASLAEKVRAEIASFRRFHVRGPEEGADSEDMLVAGLIDDIETSLLRLIEGSDPASPEPERVKRGGGHAIARAKVWSHADSSGEAPHFADPNFSAATPPAGSTIPDRPLDVAKLADILRSHSDRERHILPPLVEGVAGGMRFMLPEEFAADIVARLAEAPVTGEDRT